MTKKLNFGITTDIILIFKDEVLLIKRAREPFAGFYAFPGGFVKARERVKHAALRELHEEVGIKLKKNQLKFFDYADKPSRDPRGRVISFVFYAQLNKKPNLRIAKDEIINARWFKIDKALKLNLAFDHGEILRSFVNFLNISFLKP